MGTWDGIEDTLNRKVPLERLYGQERGSNASFTGGLLADRRTDHLNLRKILIRRMF